MKQIFLSVLCYMLVLFSFGQDNRVVGKWLTFDENTGEQKATVEIYLDNGKLFGKVIEITKPEHRKDVCVECTGTKKGKPILGLEIIDGLTWDKGDKRWEGGEVLEADTGKTYDCAVWIDDEDSNKLFLRGYVAFFYRTQVWSRSK